MLSVRIVIVSVAILLVSPGSYAKDFTLSSSVIGDDGVLSEEQVYKGFGCSGKNISPSLAWSGGPENTKSFAITVFDPDAPTDSGWFHWLVYNIPSHVGGIVAGAGEPSGELLPYGAAQARSDYGQYGFGGPCPPQGDKPHRYIFTVYALKTERIDFPKNGSAALFSFLINANTLEKTSLVATYGRK